MGNKALYSVCAFALLGILVAASVKAQTPKTDRVADKATVEQTIREYVGSFFSSDAKKIATFYNEPLMVVNTGKVYTTRAELEAWTQTNLEGMRSRGIADFRLDQLIVKLLGQNVALVSFMGERRTKDGSPVEALAVTYSLRRTDGGWKIASMIFLPTADFVKLD